MKLSVCFLSYNHGHVISEALDSILAQTFADFQLIVSDDCSTDDSWEVIQRFAARDRRAVAVRTPRNLGMAGNTNFAAARATGDYIAILHHDDVVEPTLFEDWLRVADSDPAITFVFNDYLVDDRWIGHATERFALRECIDGDTFVRGRLLRGWDSPVRGTALIRRDAFERCGGMDTRFGLLADIDLWMKLARGAKVGYVGKPLIRVYRRHAADYPDEYVAFTWKRWSLLFDIHAANIDRVFPAGTLKHAVAVARFRAGVSLVVFKWLSYGIVKGRRDILQGVRDRVSVHELPVARVVMPWIARVAMMVRGGERVA
jgi:GT2 family glycosyltransferase